MSDSRKTSMTGAAILGVLLALSPVSALSGDDEPVGVVVEPNDVTSAPTDEDAAANAGGGFDTPADAVQPDQGDGSEPEPKPTTAEPND